MKEASEDTAQRRWHAIAPDEVAELLELDPSVGLTDEMIEARRARYGANRLTEARGPTVFERLLAQINNIFIYLLLAAAVVTAALGEWVDAGVIFGVVAVIVAIGFVQEGRAEAALEAVRGMLAPKARVLRDGDAQTVDAEALVIGDVVLLKAGDQVPADVRILDANNLKIQEAALTGESTAVEKSPDQVEEDAGTGDRTSVAHAATLVVAGEAKGAVVAVGDHTEIGRIGRLLEDIEALETPLSARLDTFARWLSVAILALATLTFLVGVFVWDRPASGMFMAAVAIAVAAVPEGLPAVVTVTLVLGVRRMARERAIIRRLPAVETLGSVSIICSDKTGTLTKNEMTVSTVRTSSVEVEVTGVGYVPEGSLELDGAPAELDQHPALAEALRAGSLCNDASIERKDAEWSQEGDPTEIALVVLAHKAGLEDERARWTRLDAIPFDSERQYMATLHDGPEGERVVYVKGAPERLLEMCSDLDGLDRDAWRERTDELAGRGQRVLAIAKKGTDASELDPSEVEGGLTLLGLVGLIDPPRDEAIEAVAACQGAGIHVKMITGDHALTAEAIARALGLARPDDSLTGRDIEGLDRAALRRAVMETDVFARTSPEQKLRLVEALQAERQVIAMTGDGVNDAPALKRADIGIAMGQAGTDAARRAAEMVLADDNFASIERAVEEGRTVYDNLKKAISFILPTGAAEAFIIVIAILVDLELPITPLQVLWINTVTAATLGMALAWESTERDVMKRPPRPPEEPLLTPFMIWRIAFVGLILLLGAGLLFLEESTNPETSLEYARTAAVNALVVGEIFYLVSSRFHVAPALTREGLFGSREVWIAIVVCALLQVLITHAPFMNALFGTAALGPGTWLKCLGVGATVFAAVELEKLVLRRWSRSRERRVS